MFLQAYASYMKGALFFEQEQNIEAAMINFKNTRFVELRMFCQNLGPLEFGTIFLYIILLLSFLIE
jgi:hypothetical protein